MSKDLFANYPTIEINSTIVTDLTVRLDFVSRVKNNISLFQFYQLSDGERPEDVALFEYGDTRLYWLVLMLNDIVDPYYDWLLSEKDLYAYVVSKYGAENVYGVHHYEATESSDLDSGTWVDSDAVFSTPVSNWVYENELNEQKRAIKILNKRLLGQVLAEYTKELSSYAE